MNERMKGEYKINDQNQIDFDLFFVFFGIF